MLEHADARDLVERLGFGYVAVIEQAHLATIFQAELPDALARIVVLVARQRYSQRARLEAARRPDRQRAPAAAYVEKALAGLKAQLAADVVELLLLRAIEGVVRAPEVGAGIDAVRVEPQAVELVAHVVVPRYRLRS